MIIINKYTSPFLETNFLKSHDFYLLSTFLISSIIMKVKVVIDKHSFQLDDFSPFNNTFFVLSGTTLLYALLPANAINDYVRENS